MNFYAAVTFFTVATLANARLVPSTGIFQGGSSRTTLIGPEGTVISAVSPGKSIIANTHHGVLANGAAAFSVAHSRSILARGAPLLDVRSIYAGPGVEARNSLFSSTGPITYDAPFGQGARISYAANPSAGSPYGAVLGPQQSFYARGW